MLAYLRRHRYRVLSLDAILGDGDEARVRAKFKGTVAITVDDGYEDFARVALPILAEYDCPATVFVSSGPVDGLCWYWWDRVRLALRQSPHTQVRVEVDGITLAGSWERSADARQQQSDRFCEALKRVPLATRDAAITALEAALDVELPERPPPEVAAMTWDEIRRCETRGVTIGGHTVTHPILAQCDDARARWEIAEGLHRLRTECSGPVRLFAYPNGGEADYGDREVALLGEQDVTSAFTTRPGYLTEIALDSYGSARYHLPRFSDPGALAGIVRVASGRGISAASRRGSPTDRDRQGGTTPPATSLWLVTPYYEHGWEHGAHLRTFAIAREWVRRGAAVHFVALEFWHTDPEHPTPYLEGLRQDAVITGFDRMRLRHPQLRGKIARAAVHPAARALVLGPERRAMIAELDAIAERVAPDAIVATDPHLLFAATTLRRRAPITVDWKDSTRLQYARAVRAAKARGDWAWAARAAFSGKEWSAYERYYGSRVNHNVFVSPVDAAEMARLLGDGRTVHTVPNGVRSRPMVPSTPRDSNRVIFTGAMDYPPNHHSAVWFIRHVLPRIVARRPEVRFVVAGSNPMPALRALAGPRVEVTGWVDDMRAELAQSALYVAPMVLGTGFKNKVVEALAAGTQVVGTTFAFEFLPERLQTLFQPADRPDALAEAVLRGLDDPEGNAARVAEFWARAGDEFDWSAVTERFTRVVTGAPAPPERTEQDTPPARPAAVRHDRGRYTRSGV